MPNHVTSVLTVTGPEAAITAFVAAHILKKDDGEEFAFETIIPKPACVDKVEASNIAENAFYALTGLHKIEFPGLAVDPFAWAKANGFVPSSRIANHEELLAWYQENKPAELEKGRAMLQCFRETGCLSWYDWNTEHWGTKWGAYQYKLRARVAEKLTIEFQTAWSVPLPILRKLMGMHLALRFELEAIDEGGPEYVGVFCLNEERFEKVDHDADRYRRVYGRDPYSDDDKESEVVN
jgi:hypothetical protein